MWDPCLHTPRLFVVPAYLYKVIGSLSVVSTCRQKRGGRALVKIYAKENELRLNHQSVEIFKKYRQAITDSKILENRNLTSWIIKQESPKFYTSFPKSHWCVILSCRFSLPATPHFDQPWGRRALPVLHFQPRTPTIDHAIKYPCARSTTKYIEEISRDDHRAYTDPDEEGREISRTDVYL